MICCYYDNRILPACQRISQNSPETAPQLGRQKTISHQLAYANITFLKFSLAFFENPTRNVQGEGL